MKREQDTFWSKVGIALSGTVLAQAIPLLGSLVIARLFAPSEFGIFATWLGIASLLAVALTGRFEAALAIVEDGTSRILAVLATLSTAVIFACALGALILAMLLVPPQFLTSVSDVLVWLIVPMSLLMSVASTWQSWAAAEGRLGALTTMRIVQATSVTGIQIFSGWIAPNAVGLAYGHLIGVLLGVLAATYLMPLKPGLVSNGVSHWTSTKDFWRTHRRFPLWALPADVINTAAGQLPLLILASRFGAEVVGLLALSMRVLGAPISVLGSSVLDVFKRTSAASFREHGHCRDEYWRTFKVLSAGAFAVTLIILVAAEPLFVLAFGETWRQAGVFASWLMPMFALRFVASPLSYVFYVTGKQHVDLVWQVALFLMTVATLNVPSSHAGAIQAYSAGYALLYVVYLALSWRFSKGYDRNH